MRADTMQRDKSAVSHSGTGDGGWEVSPSRFPKQDG